jgi:hypothetical protein
MNHERMAVVYQKEISRLNLPTELVKKVLTYCTWVSSRTILWYIVASKVDACSLHRAKQMDDAYQYLAPDETDVYTVFRNRFSPNEEILDYVRHIEMNRTV